MKNVSASKLESLAEDSRWAEVSTGLPSKFEAQRAIPESCSSL